MTSIIFCGKGGQGVLYASNIFVKAIFLNTSLYVSSSDIHGLARRGGSVRSEIKYSTSTIFSPVVEKADYIVDFDGSEHSLYKSMYTSNTTIISIKQPNDLIGYCKFIVVDSSEISLQNNIPKRFQNMILLVF
jgi:Pyruvate/2-oxoacid:ferredoxin oxidoreductase gamma subunit